MGVFPPTPAGGAIWNKMNGGVFFHYLEIMFYRKEQFSKYFQTAPPTGAWGKPSIKNLIELKKRTIF